ncbi:Cytochrome bo(3) ubiquinol oxidase subunit 3 [Aquisphaera giovannonii]|uniref:Cytochrome bo(3) ubiquinol oxidase subunit 3 n=1 Tax=Aquisphaera giovannonii TaxID=406548 RepID=A0A5B9W237_9BACT|nr:cytochrome c oxidase subunit 3 [Aquisphaera giovannonii]QEH34065.1 Cytochrome bo(3) ubiquinol oxidase subunit 3 [Aquisphaera giovannonii]
MADATATPPATPSPAHGPAPAVAHHHDHQAPVTPGKVAMWLFLATEVMFFTGLIGSYIVLRAGSPRTSYTNLYAPTTSFKEIDGTYGVVLRSRASDPEAAAQLVRSANPEVNAEEAHEIVTEAAAGEPMVVNHLTKEKADSLAAGLANLGAAAAVEGVVTHDWPKPYDDLTNPLSINLTAFNTFVLICSSVTMVLSLSAIQQGKKGKSLAYLGLTIAFGSFFLGVQVYEYYELMIGRHYPPGISPTGHFRPWVSLFASCFFTMTGFHGLHVTGGVITLILVFLRSLMGAYGPTNYHTIEYAGLYWHFVDLVWIILFTIVYLV